MIKNVVEFLKKKGIVGESDKVYPGNNDLKLWYISKKVMNEVVIDSCISNYVTLHDNKKIGTDELPEIKNISEMYIIYDLSNIENKLLLLESKQNDDDDDNNIKIYKCDVIDYTLCYLKIVDMLDDLKYIYCAIRTKSGPEAINVYRIIPEHYIKSIDHYRNIGNPKNDIFLYHTPRSNGLYDISNKCIKQYDNIKDYKLHKMYRIVSNMCLLFQNYGTQKIDTDYVEYNINQSKEDDSSLQKIYNTNTFDDLVNVPKKYYSKVITNNYNDFSRRVKILSKDDKYKDMYKLFYEYIGSGILTSIGRFSNTFFEKIDITNSDEIKNYKVKIYAYIFKYINDYDKFEEKIEDITVKSIFDNVYNDFNVIMQTMFSEIYVNYKKIIQKKIVSISQRLSLLLYGIKNVYNSLTGKHLESFAHFLYYRMFNVINMNYIKKDDFIIMKEDLKTTAMTELYEPIDIFVNCVLHKYNNYNVVHIADTTIEHINSIITSRNGNDQILRNTHFYFDKYDKSNEKSKQTLNIILPMYIYKPNTKISKSVSYAKPYDTNIKIELSKYDNNLYNGLDIMWYYSREDILDNSNNKTGYYPKTINSTQTKASINDKIHTLLIDFTRCDDTIDGHCVNGCGYYYAIIFNKTKRIPPTLIHIVYIEEHATPFDFEINFKNGTIVKNDIFPFKCPIHINDLEKYTGDFYFDSKYEDARITKITKSRLDYSYPIEYNFIPKPYSDKKLEQESIMNVKKVFESIQKMNQYYFDSNDNNVNVNKIYPSHQAMYHFYIKYDRNVEDNDIVLNELIENIIADTDKKDEERKYDLLLKTIRGDKYSKRIYKFCFIISVKVKTFFDGSLIDPELEINSHKKLVYEDSPNRKLMYKKLTYVPFKNSRNTLTNISDRDASIIKTLYPIISKSKHIVLDLYNLINQQKAIKKMLYALLFFGDHYHSSNMTGYYLENVFRELIYEADESFFEKYKNERNFDNIDQLSTDFNLIYTKIQDRILMDNENIEDEDEKKKERRLSLISLPVIMALPDIIKKCIEYLRIYTNDVVRYSELLIRDILNIPFVISDFIKITTLSKKQIFNKYKQSLFDIVQQYYNDNNNIRTSFDIYKKMVSTVSMHIADTISLSFTIEKKVVINQFAKESIRKVTEITMDNLLKSINEHERKSTNNNIESNDSISQLFKLNHYYYESNMRINYNNMFVSINNDNDLSIDFNYEYIDMYKNKMLDLNDKGEVTNIRELFNKKIGTISILNPEEVINNNQISYEMMYCSCITLLNIENNNRLKEMRFNGYFEEDGNLTHLKQILNWKLYEQDYNMSNNTNSYIPEPINDNYVSTFHNDKTIKIQSNIDEDDAKSYNDLLTYFKGIEYTKMLVSNKQINDLIQEYTVQIKEKDISVFIRNKLR